MVFRHSQWSSIDIVPRFPAAQPLTKTGCPAALARRIVHLYTRKVGRAPASAWACAGWIRGMPAGRPEALMRLSKMEKHLSRACGGSTGLNVSDSIQRAFRIEGQRIIESMEGTAQSQKAKFIKNEALLSKNKIQCTQANLWLCWTKILFK